MKILALDLGTKTGWAINQPNQIVSGMNSFDTGRHEGGGMRFLRFKRWVQEIIELDRPDAVYYEEVAKHAGTHASHVYGGLVATMQAELEQQRISYTGVSVGTIKKHATGKGNSKKDLMIKSAQQIFNAAHSFGITKQIRDDNEADAICLLDYAMQRNSVSFESAPVERARVSAEQEYTPMHIGTQWEEAS